MDWQEGMNRAIEYIEDNLSGEISLDAAARYAGCSVWEYQRLFSFLAQIPVGEYIRRRRLTLAAQDITSGNEKLISIALRYGYDSQAAFTRAFKQLFGVTPSSVRSGRTPLVAYPRITFENMAKERNRYMSKYSERGYTVVENGPVYFTKDMDKTVEWFKDVLGWYGGVVARNDAGQAIYGCVFDYPDEIAIAKATRFRGFHLFPGEPRKGVVGFLMVKGIDALHALVKKNGWVHVSDIVSTHWGARECAVTTPEGSILRFFEEV